MTTRSLIGRRAGGVSRPIQAAGALRCRRCVPAAAMETMTFPRYSPDDIISYLRSHILEGAEARNLVKGDVFGSPRVREGGAGPLQALLAAVWDGRAAPARVIAGMGWAGLGGVSGLSSPGRAVVSPAAHGLSFPVLWELGKNSHGVSFPHFAGSI